MATIYKIINPLTDQVVYIGLTKENILLRLAKHIATCHKHRNPLSLWVHELVTKQGIFPKIKPIEEVEYMPGERERYWIKWYRDRGYKLLNVSNGGLGISLLGEKHPLCKLKDHEVKEILKKYATKKYTQQQLADEYGVSRPHISKLTLGNRWNEAYRAKKRIQNYEKKTEKNDKGD